MTPTPWRVLAVCAALAGLTGLLPGCGSTPVLQFYSLRAQGPAASAATPATPAGMPAPAAPTVVVGPVNLPALLDRPEWVVATGSGAGHELRVLEQQRWAQPLDADIAQTLAEQLNRTLGPVATAEVAGWPVLPRLRLQVDVLRLDARLEGAGGGSVNDQFRWALSCLAGGGQAGSVPARSGLVSFDGQAGGVAANRFAALAQAHAQALRQLSEQVAPLIREMGDACARR